MIDFQSALSSLKSGKAVRRSGWNGKDQFVVADKYGSRAFVKGPESLFPVQPTLAIKNQQNQWVVGWLPSMSDLFALDWEILENPLDTEEHDAIS